MTAQEFTRVTAGGYYPAVSATQPPPGDMPALTLMVLDALGDGSETIYSMRNCGDMAPFGVALVGESHLLDALRSALGEGLIEVEVEHVVVDGRLLARPPVRAPGTADEDLRRYWFCMTPAGWARREAASEVLNRYRDSHPLKPASMVHP